MEMCDGLAREGRERQAIAKRWKADREPPDDNGA
jgi:hypothetical protein